MKKPKIGLLPLYLELYDKSWPQLRPRIDRFRETIIGELAKRGAEVVPAEVCRIRPEFEKAVAGFEEQNADIIVTLHLAYSPSLESSDALARTRLPIVVLDTTPAFDFTEEQDPDEILYNHGIHGVQDMCNLLLRNNKEFFIEAGHWKESDVLDRVVSWARAARLVKNMRSARVGRIGASFEGMGDFAVPEDELLSSIGIEAVQYDAVDGKRLLEQISNDEIQKEIEENKKEFSADEVCPEVLKRTAEASLLVRKWIEINKLTAFTANFLAIDKQSGIPCMPFLEASKAMARGTGYAGEGDILTAALAGALLPQYPETSFTEMFCPDWKNSSIFLSHMGEMNLKLAAQKPILKENDFPFTDAENPAVAFGRFKAGRVVFADLAPAASGKFTFIVATGEMLEIKGEDRMKDSIHGWLRPDIRIEKFLAAYSRLGGTHHAVLVYGCNAEDLEKFGELMGWTTIKIR